MGLLTTYRDEHGNIVYRTWLAQKWDLEKYKWVAEKSPVGAIDITCHVLCCHPWIANMVKTATTEEVAGTKD